MSDENIKLRVCRRILGFASLCLLLFITYTILQQPDKPLSSSSKKNQFISPFPFSQLKEINSEEKRIAKRFAIDTLPGLMQNGLIQKYKRNQTGTFLYVAGNLWKCRSKFFKRSLLTQVFVHNKVNGYELSTKIMDSLSERLYAQISSDAKIEFYD